MNKQNIIGKTKHDEYIERDGKTYSAHALVEDGHGDLYLECIGGGAYKESSLLPLTDKDKEQIEEAYISNGMVYCEVCSTAWDCEDHEMYKVDYEACVAYCNECRPFEPKPLDEPEDLFQSPNLTGVPHDEDYKEVEELFCDSSGFGASYEAALTKEQATKRVQEIFKEHEGTQLYSAVTGVGQFQVYVTIYKHEPKE